jgi:hypothetical protein
VIFIPQYEEKLNKIVDEFIIVWKREIDKSKSQYNFVQTLISADKKIIKPVAGKIMADVISEQTLKDRFNYVYRQTLVEHFIIQFPKNKDRIKAIIETKRKRYSDNYIYLALFKLLHDVLFEKLEVENEDIKKNYISGVPSIHQIKSLNAIMNNDKENIWFNGKTIRGISRFKIRRTLLSTIRKERKKSKYTEKELEELNRKYNAQYRKTRREVVKHLPKKEHGPYGYNPNLSTVNVKTEKEIKEMRKTKLADFLGRAKPEKKKKKGR